MNHEFKEITLTIPMVPNMEITASETASAVASYIDLDKNQIDELKIALIEACLNAFEHSKSKEKLVHITFQVLPDELRIIIQDHGKGFNPTQLEEPKIEKKIHSLRKRGWGLKIISSLMDHVSIYTDSEGTTILMVKKK